MSGTKELGEAIERVIASPAEKLVAAYFDASGPFAGATFDLLGAEESSRNAFTPSDLLAASLLDVSMPPRFVRAVFGEDQSKAAELLQAIPDNVDLWNADEEVLACAEALWTWLREFADIGPVKAGKLLARKRPRLIPVVDSVVMKLLPLPEGSAWKALRSALEDGGLRAQIEAIRPSRLDPRVTTLRLLDVAVWMRGSGSENALEVRRSAGLDR